MKDTVAARKYAKALFAQAQTTHQVMACQQGLEEIARIVKARDSLRRILLQPFISPAEKEKLVHSILGEYATPLLERFLNLLVSRRRFDLLSQIVEDFQQDVDRSQNVQALRVRAAYPMSEAQQKTLQQKLEGWLRARVRMQVTVEPELIGGLVIQTRDREMDQSIRTQLKKLREAMIG
ncbi:MAG: ATP synthase F1 subunit delta [Elusimicrobia bacterium RIFCSPLOWO2_01_FULL_59_12]|nr:MAG: ATP synthase F1 subunit delta [Elusimicrobia bacterium RIFCSPLOWO2_01_FULL_59_12]